MTKSKFYFHLFEVTIAQMLKAHGFDKADNQRVLEVFTDIAIRYFNLLIKTVIKYMEQRSDYTPNIKDITLAFLELKVISPSKQLDKYDIDPLTNEGIENFEKWFNDDMNTRMREIARPNREFLEHNKKAKLKLQNVKSKMENLTKALDEQAKQAQLQNPTMPYLPPPSLAGNKQTPIPYSMYQNPSFDQTDSKLEVHGNGNNDEEENDNDVDKLINDYDIPSTATDEDWVEYLIRDQIITYLVTNGLQKSSVNQPNIKNDNHHIKPSLFKNTVLSEYIPEDLKHIVESESKSSSDFLIAGPMPEKLLHACPYYKSDDEDDDDDDYEDENDDDNDGDEDDNDDGDNGNDSHSLKDHRENSIHVNSEADKTEVNANKNNPGLAAYDYYEHHKLYDDEMEDLDLYGQNDTNSNDLNLFG